MQPEQEQVDRMALEAAKHTESIFQEMMKPILNILDKTEDLETLRKVLKDDAAVQKLYEEMDSPELEDVLRQAIYLSELIGRSVE